MITNNNGKNESCNEFIELELADEWVRPRFTDTAISVGAILILWLFFVQLIASLVLWVNGSIVGWTNLVPATALSIFTVALLGSPQTARRQVLLVAGALILLSGAFGIVSMLHDFSVDGQNYHQQAVIELTRGWNPYFGLPVDGSQALWVNSYAKGAWLISATIALATSNIEAGKAINLIYGMSAFLLALPAVSLLVRNNRVWVGCLAGAAALNPVLGYQWPTYYLDSQIGSHFLVILAVMALAVCKAIQWRLAAVIIAASLVMLTNIKFTGLIFACAIIPLLAFGTVLYWRRTYIVHILLGGGAAIAFGVFIVGWNPYVSNTLQHGTPFYPLVGPDRVDIITAHGDKEFLEKDRISKLLLSTFARSHSLMADDLKGKKEIELKPPFAIFATELHFFATRQDIRIGGFGPLFGGVLFLSVLIFSLALLSARSKRGILMIGAVSLSLLATVLVIPEPWWARYVPQFWLIPPILILSGFFYSKNQLMLRVSQLATTLLLINSALVWGAAIAGVTLSEISLRKQLTHISLLSAQGHNVYVQFLAEPSKLRLMSEGIDFQEVEKLECPHPMPLIRSFATICVDRLELHDTDYNPSFFVVR